MAGTAAVLVLRETRKKSKEEKIRVSEFELEFRAGADLKEAVS